MDQMVGTLQQFFGELQNAQDDIWLHNHPRWNRSPSQKARATFDLLKDSIRPIQERELNQSLSPANPVHADFAKLNRFLFLPPLERNAEFVPVLSLKCHLDRHIMEVRYRVMLYSFNEGINALCGIGFRIETPEGQNQHYEGDEEERNDGSHDFFHSQLIKSIEKGPIIECPEWLPCSQPSFPIIANCPVTMLIGVLLALYGKRYSFDIINGSTIHNIEKYINKINPWISWPI
jgi:hypothetical protein